MSSSVVFTSNDPYLLDVSVKAPMVYGARLFLKAKKRGTPILLARLSGVNGPMLALQEVDEFTRDSKNLQSMLVCNNVGNGGELILRPYIPNLSVNLSMFAHASTFANGATTLNSNTDQFEKVYDPVTAETIAVLHLAIEMPQGENSFCFNYAIDQHSSHGSPVAATITVNNVAYKFNVEPAIVVRGSAVHALLVTTDATGFDDSLTVTGKVTGTGPTGITGSFTIDNAAHTYDTQLTFSPGGTIGKFGVDWSGTNTYGSGSATTAEVIIVGDWVKQPDIKTSGDSGTSMNFLTIVKSTPSVSASYVAIGRSNISVDNFGYAHALKSLWKQTWKWMPEDVDPIPQKFRITFNANLLYKNAGNCDSNHGLFFGHGFASAEAEAIVQVIASTGQNFQSVATFNNSLSEGGDIQTTIGISAPAGISISAGWTKGKTTWDTGRHTQPIPWTAVLSSGADKTVYVEVQLSSKAYAEVKNEAESATAGVQTTVNTFTLEKD